LSFKSDKKGIDISDRVISLMKGKFDKDDKDNTFFLKKNKRIELVNTATGIKYFGIFQVLSQNNYLNKDTILILDEPEVHLHPKWQLKMAKLIVELVKNGVKIVVNSHSPYMIEALERYSEKADIVSDFYLAEDGFIAKVDDNNSKTLSKIFSKLSEPFDVFEKMDSEILQGG
jgi:predicted ATPase